jgi:aminopeptidase N
MAAKIVNPSFPDVNHELRFLLQNYPAAYEVDRTVGANPIRQELANLDEAGSLYGAIIYQKAPIVMRQLEQLVGAGGLRDGLREYLRRYRFGNASWTDLVALLDERTDADLTAWSHAWIDEPGRPTVHVTRRTTRARFEGLTLTQGDPRGRDLIWPQHIDVHFDNGPPRSIELTAADIDVDVPVGRAPRWVLPVGGYGLFDLDPSTLEYISRSLVRIDDPVIRATALVDLWEAMLEGKIAAGRVIDDVLLALTQESHELLVQQMLDDVRVAFWRFTAADDRPIVAPRIEAALRQGLSRASSTSARAAWFDAFRRTAITPGSVEWLTDVWQRKTAIPGLPLSEDDETDLAAELALRDVPDADAILQTQLQRIDNPDRKARFAFLMPALSQDATVRDAFFERLKDPEARQHEAWVLDGARYLHHPLQAGSSRRYLHDALDLTLSIQRTGDIFFPKRWADATLSGYQAVQTAAEVRAFIDGLPPDYPERLRWVLLASADPLFRAAQLLNQ